MAEQILPPYGGTRPTQERHEFVADDILRLAQVPAAEIMGIRSPVPRELFPSRYGYDQTPFTIHDVIDTDAFAPKFRSWTSGPDGVRRRNDDPPAADPSVRNSFLGGAGKL